MNIDIIVVSLQISIPHHSAHEIGVPFEVDPVLKSIIVIQAFDTIDGMSPGDPGDSDVESHHKEIKVAPVEVVQAVGCSDAEAVTASPRVLERDISCRETCAFRRLVCWTPVRNFGICGRRSWRN